MPWPAARTTTTAPGRPCRRARCCRCLQREVPGQVLEVELEQERDRWIYEIKLLTPAGQLTKVKLDARTAEVLRIKSRDDQGPDRERRQNQPGN